MAQPCPKLSPLYQPRDPKASDLWRVIDEHFDAFQQVYDERFQAKYGYWRPIVQQSVAAFLKCGDLQEGFARVRCPDCYWNKSRGMVKKAEAEASAESSSEDAISATTATRSSQTWAMLIKLSDVRIKGIHFLLLNFSSPSRLADKPSHRLAPVHLVKYSWAAWGLPPVYQSLRPVQLLGLQGRV